VIEIGDYVSTLPNVQFPKEGRVVEITPPGWPVRDCAEAGAFVRFEENRQHWGFWCPLSQLVISEARQ
jgi:hypothetical protein